MKILSSWVTLLVLFSLASCRGPILQHGHVRSLHPTLQDYVEKATAEFDAIDGSRRALLTELADYVGNKRARGETAHLIFICTHNSRRSQMSQVWAQTAAWWYHHDGVQAWSGGTEATAFNPRAIGALRRAGFQIEKEGNGDNPRYRITYSDGAPPIDAFSKQYHHPHNPGKSFCAVMTCGDADRKCPAVDGCDERVALTFVDPKAFDGTPQEKSKYDERCRQIAAEMLFLFSRVPGGVRRVR